MALTKVKQGMTALPFSNRNKIINGNFDIWQRGTSQTANGYGSADRWGCGHNGSTKTASREPFVLGQTEVPGNPKYFMRHVVTSVTNAANFCSMQQHVESVAILAGKIVTLSFWAKANANKKLAVEFAQVFGTGGSPSANITGIGAQVVNLTTVWQKFVITITLPSIAGKTLGTNNDDRLSVYFWFDAGSNLALRTANLGQQSGTFDIAQVQLEEGEIATPFEQRHIADELALCQRYYEVGRTLIFGYVPSNKLQIGAFNTFSAVKRAVPTFTGLYNPYNNLGGGGGIQKIAVVNGFFWSDVSVAAGVGYAWIDYTADAEL